MPDFRMDKTKPVGPRTNVAIANYNVGAKPKRPEVTLEPAEVEAPPLPSDERPRFDVVQPTAAPEMPQHPHSGLLAGCLESVVEDEDDSDDGVETGDNEVSTDVSGDEFDSEEEEDEDDDDEEEESD